MLFMLGILVSVPFLIVLVLLALGAEHFGSPKWALFTTLSAGIVLYFLLPGVSVIYWVVIAVTWIPIGIGWSFWRWRRYCGDIVQQVRHNKIGVAQATRQVGVTQNIFQLLNWTISWPISLAESIFGDVIDLIQVFVMKIGRRTYMAVSDQAISDIEYYKNDS